MKISVSNHENLHFSSKVRLKADSSGLVDLTKSVPSCGAYQVPDLMALYWKMDYQKGSDKRLLKFHEVTFNHILDPINTVYRKVASSNTSRLEAHESFFRLLMKGIFDPYVL